MLLARTFAAAALAAALSFLSAGPLFAQNGTSGNEAQSSATGTSDAELVWCGCWGGPERSAYYSHPFQTAEGACHTSAMKRIFFTAIAKKRGGGTNGLAGACYTYPSRDAVIDKYEAGIGMMKERGLIGEWVEVVPPQD